MVQVGIYWRELMHIISTKGTGTNTYVKVDDIVSAIRHELNCNEHIPELMVYRIQMLASNLEGIQFRNRSGNIHIKQ